MMGRREHRQGKFFYEVNLDEVLPAKHLVLRIDAGSRFRLGLQGTRAACSAPCARGLCAEAVPQRQRRSGGDPSPKSKPSHNRGYAGVPEWESHLHVLWRSALWWRGAYAWLAHSTASCHRAVNAI